MTDTEIRIAIAEACGWSNIRPVGSVMPNQFVGCFGPLRGFMAIPDYPNDLNAMHEAEKTMSESQNFSSAYNLCKIVGFDFVCFAANSNKDLTNLINASARQRAEAFLRTIGKWVEK